MSFPNSFGQVIDVKGAGVGFIGTVSRMGSARDIVSRQVLPTSLTPLQFGEGAINLGNATNGNYQSLRDYLGANAANAQNLQTLFAGLVVKNIRTQAPYSGYAQNNAVTLTQVTSGSTAVGTSMVLASATGVQVGQSVEGPGVQPGTLVTVVSGTTLTLSLTTTAIIPTATTIGFTTPIAGPVVGSYPQGVMADVLLRGSMPVFIAAGSAPVENGAVYIRTVANASLPGSFVGDFESSDESATTALTIGTTIGSTTLTTSAGTGLAVGQRIVAPGVPANTYIVSGATTSWVMSQQALATIASGGAMTTYNTALLGSLVDPYLVFRTGQIDSNNIAEITVKTRHSA